MVLPGYGFGDFILIFELVRRMVSDCKNAPLHFQEAHQIVLNLYSVLQHIEKDAEKPSSVFQHDRGLVDQLNHLIKPCQAPLAQLSEIVAKFRNVGSSSSISAVGRFRFPQKKVLDIRGQLLIHIEKLNIFLVNAGLSSTGRIEDTVNFVSESIIQVDHSVSDIHRSVFRIESSQNAVLQAVERIGARNRLERNEGSVLSDHTNDEKEMWKDLRRNLIREGFTSKHISRHQQAIKARLEELVEHDLWDSEANSEINAGRSHIDTVGNGASDDTKSRVPRVTMTIAALTSPPQKKLTPQQILTCNRRLANADQGTTQGLHKTPDSRTEIRMNAKATNHKASGEFTAYNSIIKGLEEASGESNKSKSPSKCFPASFMVTKHHILPTKGLGNPNYLPIPVQSSYQVSSSTFRSFESSLSFWNAQSATLKDFLMAAVKGDLEFHRSYLKAGNNPDAFFGKDHRALCISSLSKNTSVTRLFLDYGANPNFSCEGPLYSHFAIHIAASEGDLGCMQLLLDCGGELDALALPSNVTPLMLAALSSRPMINEPSIKKDSSPGWTGNISSYTPQYAEIVELLLRRGASVNFTDDYKLTALHYAVVFGNKIRIVKLLLRYGANIDAQTDYGRTALYLAASAGGLGVVELLLRSGAKPNVPSKNGSTALSVAITLGYTDIVRLLLEHHADPDFRNDILGITNLHIAAQEGNEDIVYLLLNHGADPNLVNGTPMSKGWLEDLSIREWMSSESQRPVATFRDTPSHSWSPPLHAAVRGGHVNIASLLLNHGAAIDARHNGQSAAEVALREEQFDVLNLLESKGARAADSPRNNRQRGTDGSQRFVSEEVIRSIQESRPFQGLPRGNVGVAGGVGLLQPHKTKLRH